MDKTELYSETEAALYLGITKELLFAYIRNAPKKHIGDSRKLTSKVIDGQNYFEKQELDSFDLYLKEPWSDTSSQRPSIPTYIKEYLKVEVNGRCPITGEGYPLEDAHIIPYSESLNHHHHNIIRISGNVHSKIDNGVISRDLLKETKNELINELKRKTSGKVNSFINVPTPHPIYIGRLAQLYELTVSMESERLIVIEGIGGIGKTQLLIQALHNVNYHNPVIWIDIESAKTFSDFLVLFNNIVSNNLHISFSENGIESLREVQITFVLDSIESLLKDERDKVEDFLNSLLLKTLNVQLLITSQQDLSFLDYSVKSIKIQGLDSEESTVLIVELLKDKVIIPQNELDWILDFCNGHPLSIKLITHLIKYYQSSEQTIISLKKNQRVELPNKKQHNKNTSLYTCLSTAYNILTEQQKSFLHHLKFYPAGLKLIWAEKQFEELSFYKIIADLKQLFFVETQRDTLNLQRLIIPNPIRTFLKEAVVKDQKVEDMNIEKEAITNIMMEAVTIDLYHIESNTHNDLSYGIMRMEDEIPNLLLALNIAQERADSYEKLQLTNERDNYLRIVCGVASALGKFCHTRSYYQEGLLFATSGIDAYIKLKDYTLAATQYMYLAQIQSRLSDINGLQKTVEKLHKLSELSSNREVKINALWAKGLLNFDTGKFSEAKENFVNAADILEKCIDEYENIYKNNSDDIIKASQKSNYGNLFLLKSNIAKTYEFQGEYLTATPLYKEIIASFLKISTEDDIASIYHHYAHCLCKTGNIKEGVSFYYKSIEIFARIGHYEYLANSISDLGQFVEDYPEIVSHSLLDEEMFSLALGSINNQLFQTPHLIEQISINPNIIPYNLIGKIFWMLKAISFSEYSYVFSYWVLNLSEEIQINFSEPNYFIAMLNLGHCAGQVNNWKGNSELEPIFIKSMLQSSLLVNGGPDLKSKTRIFYWLAKWMQFSGIKDDATAENLWEQAWESFEK